MKLVAIIPCLNEERYLPLLLSDLARQTRKPDQVIVADAGSTDNTLDIISKFRASLNVKVIAGGMPAYGRNMGAKLAPKEAMLCFFDSDVSLHPNFLKNLLGEIKTRKLAGGTCANIPFYRPWEKGSKSWLIRGFDRWFYLWHNSFLHLTAWARFPVATGTFIAASNPHFEKIGGFNEAMPFAEDSDFSNRLSKAGRWGVLKTINVRVSTRRFDSKGRLLFPLKIVVFALIFRLFKMAKSWNYFED
jgi:glycosyltransferase involved in cell wall biosynthesis